MFMVIMLTKLVLCLYAAVSFKTLPGLYCTHCRHDLAMSEMPVLGDLS